MTKFRTIAAAILARVSLKNDEGAGLAEYALLLLLIAVACVVALTALGGTISAAYTNANGMFN